MSAFRLIAAASALASLAALAAPASAAELPNRAARPAAGAPAPARHCEINGVQGVATAGGACVRLSGYVSAQFAAGAAKRQSIYVPTR